MEAFKIIERCNSNNTHNIIPVNACVGSGKTDVAIHAFGDFIMKNRDGKTISMFVTPRIRLCAQQAEEISRRIEDEFGLHPKQDFDVIRKDCTQRDLDLKSSTFTSKHAVFVVCDESLWGEDPDNPGRRWRKWMSFLSKLEGLGWKLGNVALDEAHNFTSNWAKVFGEEEGVQ